MTHGLETARAPADAGATNAQQMVVPNSLGLTSKTATVNATTQALPFSVLDLVPTRAGELAGRAIARSVELARHVEQLGYKRYRVSRWELIDYCRSCIADDFVLGIGAS